MSRVFCASLWLFLHTVWRRIYHCDSGNLSDKYGNLVNLWPSAIAAVPVPGDSPARGTYAGWVVPSNYDTKTWGPLPPGIITSGHKIASRNEVPKNNFAPRLGFAWQPVRSSQFVLRGGAGFFYDRVPGNTIVHAVEQSPPYAPTLDQGASSNQFSSLAHPFQDWQRQTGEFPIFLQRILDRKIGNSPV